jgi:hypothetical protein
MLLKKNLMLCKKAEKISSWDPLKLDFVTLHLVG